MEAVAKLRNNPTSTRKTRLVVDLIRGMEVNQALNVLKFQFFSYMFKKKTSLTFINFLFKKQGKSLSKPLL